MSIEKTLKELEAQRERLARRTLKGDRDDG